MTRRSRYADVPFDNDGARCGAARAITLGPGLSISPTAHPRPVKSMAATLAPLIPRRSQRRRLDEQPDTQRRRRVADDLNPTNSAAKVRWRQRLARPLRPLPEARSAARHRLTTRTPLQNKLSRTRQAPRTESLASHVRWRRNELLLHHLLRPANSSEPTRRHAS
jgi:hypothetical protein